ncbi:MAG: hypothetical protein Q4B52_07865 [Tissierellia bacterium]|nr:hypothetical protein [Tissierellia bacterium]
MIKNFLEKIEQGNAKELAELFCDDCILHDSSLIKAGEDTLHAVGKMAVEMIFHNKFGLNGGGFKIFSKDIKDEKRAWYFIDYKNKIIPVMADISETQDGKIKRINVYPL